MSDILSSTLEPTPPSTAPWIITFCDLISLLLTFFILIYAHQHIHISDQSEAMATHPSTTQPLDSYSPQSGDMLYQYQYLFEILQKQIQKAPELARVHINKHATTFTLSIPFDLLFEIEQDPFSLKGLSILTFIINSIQLVDRLITLEAIASRQDLSHSDKDQHGLTLRRLFLLAQELHQSGYAPSIATRIKFDDNTYASSSYPASLAVSNGRVALADRRVQLTIFLPHHTNYLAIY